MTPWVGSRRRSGAVAPVVEAIVLLALIASACGGSTGAASSDRSSTPPATVVFRVSGEIKTADVQYGLRRSPTKRRVDLPWQATTTAPIGSTVALRADQLPSANGYRLECLITVTIAGHEPFSARDSSHIVDTKQGGAPRKIQYDGQCLARQVVSLTGL
jgi:hypothetical protein